MGTKILSVVIPTYNMEEFLSRCLETLIVDEKKLTRLEVLVINDGSKDSSLQIANKYHAIYPGTIKVIDKENGNYGSCINRGLKEATGKYFRILDADDTFNKNALSKLLEVLDSSDDEMIITNYTYVYDTTGSVKKERTRGVVFGKSYDKFDFSKGNDEILSMHAITYKTSLLKNINLHLDEGVSYTDLEYVYFPMQNVKSIKFFDIYLYEYHIGREGQTVDPRSQAKSLKSFLTVTKRLVDDYVSGYSNKDEILKANQRITINKIIYATFKIGLVLCNKNSESDAVLKDIYRKIKRTDKNVMWLKMKKIKPIVLLWDITGIYFSSIKKLFTR